MGNKRKIKKRQIKIWKNEKINIKKLEKKSKKEKRKKYKQEIKEIKIKAEEKVSDLNRKKRMRNAILIYTMIFGALIFRIGWLQFVMGAELHSMAYIQQTLDRSVNPRRGTIYDATGENILAISSTVETVTVNPTNISKENKEKVAKALSDIFNLDYDSTLKRVSKRSSIETIVKKVDKEKADELRTWLVDNNITAGINIDKLLEGAKIAQGKYLDKNLKYNDCYKYAVVRNILYKNEKNIEILVSYEPKLHYIIEWWKQLYGESEGKDLKGIYPTGAEFTTDLHSLGQYIQEGRRNLFETVIDIKEADSDVFINQDEDNLDELNYLVGKGLDYVNKKAMEGTIEAHVDGGVPNIILTVDKLNECTIGHLIYFFELACAMSGRLLEVNPFNQPGVEKYKKNMFRLLGKPGYVEEKKVKEEKAEKPKRGRKKKEQKI